MKVSGGFKNGLLLEYNSVFCDKPKAVHEYLSGISQESVLLFCSYFLGFNYSNSKYKNVRDLLEMFFRTENHILKEFILDKCTALELERQTNVIIINIETCLQLFEFAFCNLDNQQTLSDAETEVNLFKAIIVQNQINCLKEANIAKTLEDAPSDISLALWPLLQSFRYSEFYTYDVGEVFITQLIKSRILFEFLERDKATQPLLLALLEYFEVTDWRTYLKRFLPLVTGIITVKSEGYLDIIVPKDENYKQNIDFIKKLVVTSVNPNDSRDFIEIRDKPFYEVEEGTFRIVFKLFALEKIYKGLMFLLWRLNKSLPPAVQVKGDFKSFWGLNFSEKELLYKVLDSTYNRRYITYTGAKISDEYKIDGGPDYYMRNGKRVFLFEAKDVLIKADVKRSTDYNILVPELEKKFYYELKNGIVKRRAVLQLISCVKSVLNRAYTFDNNYKAEKVEIYPILVVFDNVFNTAGLNILVNFWFEQELNKLKQKDCLEVSRVRRLTIIDIDTLIFHQDLFAKKKITLNDSIEQYINYTTFNHNPKRPYQGLHDAKSHLQNTFIPYSTFLSRYVRANKLRELPKSFKESGFDLFK